MEIFFTVFWISVGGLGTVFLWITNVYNFFNNLPLFNLINRYLHKNDSCNNPQC